MIIRCLFAFISFSLLFSPIAMARETIPTALQPCIRQLATKFPVKMAFINQKYREGTQTYYLVNLFPSQIELGVRDAILSTKSSDCRVLAQYRSGEPIPVNNLISVSVARGLTLALVKSEISEAGGLQQYQAFLNRAAQDTGRLYLEPNKVWALRQLGVKLLPSIEILPPSSQKQDN